jgi:hypothetical protein
MSQNQFFEIMEENKSSEELKKAPGDTPKPRVRKPATGAVPKTTTGPAKTPAKTSGSRSVPKPTAKPTEDISSTVPVKPTAEKPEASTPAGGKRSKSMAAASKKLKDQKKDLTSLGKNRDRLMKELISAIENNKKSKKIRSLARDFSRIEKKVKIRTASYLRAKKKLTKKMK